ncbi:MAG TPA: ABC transporter permease [Pyrinomonadaceae bacterium]|nr:ABC transporter permease [Pyrinomonadaceae bacterium]
MDSILRDLRFSIRSLLKRPGLTIIAVLTLAVGIGANSAIFSVVNALLINPLPFPQLERVVAVWESQPGQGVVRNEASLANFLDWRSQNQTFEKMGTYRGWSTNLTGNDTPERIQGYLLTANFLDVLGVAPALGRGFAPDEDQPGKAPVVILSYDLWQRRFGGDPSIVGKSITLNSISRTVIGVMPQGVNYPAGADVIAPLTITPEMASNRQFHTYLVVGRLKPNISVAQAQSDLANIAARLQKDHPETNTGWSVATYSIIEDTTRLYKSAVVTLMAAVGLVLLIVCANVANLMLARAAGRQKEMALRAALGASRWQLVRQLLTESVLLAVVGGLFGILIAYWGVDLLRGLNPGEAAKFAPGWHRLGVSTPVLGFNLVLSIFSGVLFGLAPAWQMSRTDLNEGLKEGGRQTSSGTHRLRGLLVVSEVALSLMLLVSAGLLLRTFLVLLKTDAGFNPQNVMTMSLVVPAAKYKEESQRASFFSELVNRVKTLPGVESAAAISHLPLGGRNSSNPFLIEGLPEPQRGQEYMGRNRTCTPDYFKTMEIPIIRGRAFTDEDREGSTPVIIINETLANRFWPNGDPIGKRMRIDGPLAEFPWLQVVGVVKDVKHELTLATTPDYYQPHAQEPGSSMVLVARTSVEPRALAAEMRKQVWSIDKDQPVFAVRTMEDVRAFSVSLYSFSSVSLGIFAAIALLLAAMGIYGVMSYAVTQRTQEIGIRMALGARTADVMNLVVRNGMTLALIGVVAGLAGAFGLTRLLASLLVGTSPTDVLTFASVTLGLLAVALLACYLPARRATKVDPLVALRYE